MRRVNAPCVLIPNVSLSQMELQSGLAGNHRSQTYDLYLRSSENARWATRVGHSGRDRRPPDLGDDRLGERLGTEPRRLHAVDEDGRRSMHPNVIQVSDLPLGRHDAAHLGRVRQRSLLPALRLLVRASGLAWRLLNRSLAGRLTSQVARRPREATRVCLRRRHTHVPAPRRFAGTAISRSRVRSEQVSTGSRKHRSDVPVLCCSFS